MAVRLKSFAPIDTVSADTKLSVALLTKLVAAGMVEMRISASGHVSLSLEDVAKVIREAHATKKGLK